MEATEGEVASQGGWLHVLLRVEGKVDTLDAKVDDIRERVVRLEQKGHDDRSWWQGIRGWTGWVAALALAALRWWHGS